MSVERTADERMQRAPLVPRSAFCGPSECDCHVYFWLGIYTNSDTSSEPPISRKGQAFAIDSAASIESASIIV